MNDKISTSDDSKHPVKIERFQRNLRVLLTIDERLDRADRVAAIENDIANKEADRDAAKKHANAQIEELQAEKQRLNGEVRDRAKYADVLCERRFNYRLGKVQEVRTDTQEVLDERPLTDRERQLENGLKDPKPTENANTASASGTGGSADDTDEDPDTSVLDPDSASLARDQADSAAGCHSSDADGIVVDDDHDPEKEPELPTRKKARGGKGSRGGKAKG